MSRKNFSLHRAGNWQRFVPTLCGAVLASCASCGLANASFINEYAPNNWTLTNTDADGFASVQSGGLNLVLTGGNTGSGVPGLTDFTIAAPAAGTVAFSFDYSSLDFPTFDFAGYLLGNTFVQLADSDGMSGNVKFAVSAGEQFGFRVGTADNQGEPVSSPSRASARHRRFPSRVQLESPSSC